jgi:hypothetical protein
VSSKGQGPLGAVRADILNLLAFGLGGPAMIVLSFDKGAGFMRWAHVVQSIGATEFKGTNMLGNPSLASTFDLSRA